MEEINGECLAFYLIFCPLSYLRLEIGYPKMMQFMEEDPEAVLYAENVIAQSKGPCKRDHRRGKGCRYLLQRTECRRKPLLHMRHTENTSLRRRKEF